MHYAIGGGIAEALDALRVRMATISRLDRAQETFMPAGGALNQD